MEDVRNAQPDWQVDIVAINAANQAQYGSLTSSATTLPWLQDTPDQNAWGRWARAKDELCIVDPLGNLLTVTNLGYANLADPANRDTVRSLLLNAAQAQDADQDSLADDWELHFFGNLDAARTDDRDHDGQSALMEFAFGTDPTLPGVVPPLNSPELKNFPPTQLTITYRRRLGDLLTYTLETTADFQSWEPVPQALSTIGPLQAFYDGSGMGITRASVRLDPQSGPASFLRLRAQPRP